MSTDAEELIERNDAAIAALNEAVERLEELRKGTDLDDRQRFDREIDRATEQITDLEILGGHLVASTTVIDPISPETQERLDILASRIDAAILNDFKLHAAFETVQDVISFAGEIGTIIDDHKHA